MLLTDSQRIGEAIAPTTRSGRIAWKNFILGKEWRRFWAV
jgi:hypothetical protein